ncbi:HIT family protein [Rhodocytophaga rosea]|uniref:HIT family protein n=1 Tax=Rhodocytophaga rosea TaxID=2704465 RepID=A0A6C0GNB9_9BACT|nr:HIT family protein [Rhodocytophaga rosea]
MTIFTKIIKGEIPCHKVAEDDKFLAFLDINPVAIGHTLVIPKVEVDYLFNLDDDTYTDLMLFAKRLAPAIAHAVPCLRIGVAVIGLEVPHTHIHLVPLNTMQDINFSKPKLTPTLEELKQVAENIKKALVK